MITRDGEEDIGTETGANGERDGGDGRQSAGKGAIESPKETNCVRCGKGAMGRAGVVYFIETCNGAFVKIGFSRNRARQTAACQFAAREFGLDTRLLGVMPGSIDTETWLHRKFARYRHKTEWYESSGEIRAFIAAVGLIEIAARDPLPIRAKPGAKKNAIAQAMVAMRNKTLTGARRKEIASNAAKKRWGAKK